MRCKALKPTSDSRLQDFLGTLQSFEAYTPKIPGQGYFIFPEILGVHVNSPYWLRISFQSHLNGQVLKASKGRSKERFSSRSSRPPRVSAIPDTLHSLFGLIGRCELVLV